MFPSVSVAFTVQLYVPAAIVCASVKLDCGLPAGVIQDVKNL